MNNQLADIGVIGLAVMGENLALNFLNHQFKTAVYNRTYQKTEHFVQTRASQLNVVPAKTIEDFCHALATPRKIILMVRAGEAVDSCIEELLPFLEKGDIIIDGGNSHYTDTIRRDKYLEDKGLYFVGCGISGGEEGALKGPSLMPGCKPHVWEELKPYLQAIAAKDFSNQPCCTYIGPDGAGHFVKMVHNGIEYADMQLIAEAYDILKRYPQLSESDIASIFNNWNKGELASYLIEITSEILRVKDSRSKGLLLDKILDAAGQKGTGKWTSLAAMDYYVSIPTIAEAVYARSLSAQKETRVALSALYPRTTETPKMDVIACIDALEKSLLCAKISVYAQGFELLTKASEKHNWNLNIAEIARIWQGGCIIRANFLKSIVDSYKANPNAAHLLQTQWVQTTLSHHVIAWRELLATAIQASIPIPALSSALAWFEGITSAQLPSNLTQAQRDFFGAHTFERVDRPRGEFFHHDWVNLGGNAASSTYNA